MNKAFLALDIDGTITETNHKIHPVMIEFLKWCHENKVVVGLITGRFFPFAHAQLKDLKFPYYLASQNGAQIFHMPEIKNLSNFYLSKDLVMMIDTISKDFKEDFIVYTDHRTDYKTFYRQGRFSQKLLNHISQLESTAYHPFIQIDCFANLPQKAFPCLKNFGSYEETKPLHDKIKQLPVEQSLIRDPTSDIYTMNLVTHLSASKGGAVSNILKFIDQDLPVIAAGNDRNDISLLENADIGICVGGNPPEELKVVATHFARTPGIGLIDTIKEAITQLGV